MAGVSNAQVPVHEQVSAIVTAAEAAAARMREEAEERVRARIAEGQRAADNRVAAAEVEARELLEEAREEAARVREAARLDTERAKGEATTQALTIVSRAQDEAEIIRAEAEQERTRATGEALEIVAAAQETAQRAGQEAGERARAALHSARETAGEVQGEGVELVENLREMGESLRANSARLLRDIQQIHSQMLARIDAGAGAAGLEPLPASRARPANGRTSSRPDADRLEVPEFIPRV
jgi:F0F1-type ATP synthase membrane subunit b/b'